MSDSLFVDNLQLAAIKSHSPLSLPIYGMAQTDIHTHIHIDTDTDTHKHKTQKKTRTSQLIDITGKEAVLVGKPDKIQYGNAEPAFLLAETETCVKRIQCKKIVTKGGY